MRLRRRRLEELATTRAKVVHVDLESELEPITAEQRFDRLFLIVHGHGGVLDELDIPVPAGGTLPVTDLRLMLTTSLGRAIWCDRFQFALETQLRSTNGAGATPRPTVSIVVCTRDRPEHLRTCLDALLRLRTPPDEIVVVDNAPRDDRTAEVCAALPVRYVREPQPGQARARNRGILESRGELVAFTDDDCVPAETWLDDLGSSFVDPLVMVVTGYIGPYELEHPAQYLFEKHYGFGRSRTRNKLDPLRTGPVRGAALAGAGANMIIRREAFSRVGLFAEEFGPGTPVKSGDDKYFFHATLSAGFRIVQEPRRQVWHRHRADFAALKQIMNDYGVADFAFASRCLVGHRELSALRLYQWWLAHFWHDIASCLRRRPSRMPLRLALGEMRGAASAPWRLRRSSRSRRTIEPIRLPATLDGPRGRTEIASAVVSELPRLSVTMTTYNRRDDLRLTLESLAAQEYPPDRFEVVLVVDGSTDGSAEMARTLELPYELRVFEQRNRGTAATRNRAVEVARSPLVVFLDDDIRPVPGFLSAHAKAHRDGDERHMALGYCPPATANSMWEVFLRGWWEDHYRLKAQPGHKWTFIDCSEGNASMTRTLFQSVGGYDEDFDGKNRHDWDLGYRLLTAGARFSFHPDAMAWHHYKTTVAAAVANQRQCGRLDVLLARKHPKLIGQLPLATVARLIDWKASRLGRYQLTSNVLVERGALLPLLQFYEAFGLRRRWQHLLNQLLVRAYFLGVLDAIPARQDVVAFLEPVVRKEDVTSVPLWLDGGPIVVPGDVGKVEVTVGHGGIELAAVTVLEGAGHWDWDRITQQIVDEAGEAVRLQLALEGLDRLIGDRPDAD